MGILETLKKTMDTRLPEGNMSGLKIKDIRWRVTTAGPSPNNNERVELFLLGCERARIGMACRGCFNPTTWTDNAQWTHDPIKVAEHISKMTTSRYITIGGGEPSDQLSNVLILCKELKKYGFHIIMYSWRRILPMTTDMHFGLSGSIVTDGLSKELAELENSLNLPKSRELLSIIDILIDGEYKQEERMIDLKKVDGFLSSIGSGNQRVIDLKTRVGHEMKNIESLELTNSNKLIIKLKEGGAL